MPPDPFHATGKYLTVALSSNCWNGLRAAAFSKLEQAVCETLCIYRVRVIGLLYLKRREFWIDFPISTNNFCQPGEGSYIRFRPMRNSRLPSLPLFSKRSVGRNSESP